MLGSGQEQNLNLVKRYFHKGGYFWTTKDWDIGQGWGSSSTEIQTIEFSHLPRGPACLEKELVWRNSSSGGGASACLEEELAWLLSAADWRSELVMGGIMLCSTAAHVIGGRVIYLWGLPVGGAGPCAGGLSPPPLPLQSWSEEEL